MKSTDTLLGYALAVTETTLREVADLLHVDVSLVSRWQHGQRRLKVTSDYAEKLAALLQERDARLLTHPVSRALDRLSDQADLSDDVAWRAVLKENFQMPFTSDPIPLMHPTNFKSLLEEPVFRGRGTAAQREALIHFTTHLTVGRRSAPLQIISDTYLEELRSPGLSPKERQQELVSFVSSREVEIVLTNAEDPVRLTGAISFLLPLMIARRFKLYIAPGKNREGLHGTRLLLRGRQALKLVDEEACLKLGQAALVSEARWFDRVFSSADEIIRRWERDGLKYLSKMILDRGQREESAYFYSPEPFFSSMSPELLEEVLSSNSVEEPLRQEILSQHRRLTENFEQNVPMVRNVHVYDYDQLRQRYRSTPIRQEILSLLIDRPIQLSREQMKRHLVETIDRVDRHENHSIAISQDQQFLPLNLWVKDHRYAVLYDLGQHDVFATFTDPMIVEALKRIFLNQLEELPSLYRSSDQVKDRLMQLLEEKRWL
jgi:transcriptional regulator with XRE-family HTH domain